MKASLRSFIFHEGILKDAPGNVALYWIVPSNPVDEYTNWVSASAAETTLTPEPWDFIVAQAICVRSR